MDVIDVRVNEYVGCECDSTLQGRIWSKEKGKYSGETAGCFLKKLFLFLVGKGI